ncbi:MAG: hypothetical protein ACQGVC_19530 [Myxococcota bacterium]
MKGIPRSDQALAKAALGGSEDAFGELFERYFVRVYGYVWMRVPTLADTEALAAHAMEQAFADLEGVALGADLARRGLAAAQGVLALSGPHASVTQSPR